MCLYVYGWFQISLGHFYTVRVPDPFVFDEIQSKTSCKHLYEAGFCEYINKTDLMGTGNTVNADILLGHGATKQLYADR